MVLTYWSYKDALIQAYTMPYLHIISGQLPSGSLIYLVTLEQKHLKLSPGERKQVLQQLKSQGIQWKPYNYHRFGLLAFFNWIFIGIDMVRMILFNKLNVIHAWCTPAGAIGYFLSKFTGKPLVIDSYEPHAEAMVENKTREKDGLPFKILFNLEKRLTHHAKVIVSATEGMRSYALEKYSAVIENFYVKPACVDLDFFSTQRRKNKNLVDELKLQDKIVCVYAGKFGGIYLDEEVFGFFRVAQQHWGDKFVALLLTNHPQEELKKWSDKNNFAWKNIIVKFVNHSDIPDYIGLGDFAITPVKPIPSKRYCTPIKDGEYWALGLPVVITKGISDDSGIIERFDIGAVLEELNDEAYLKAVKKIDSLLMMNTNNEIRLKIQNIAHQFRDFKIARDIYREIYGAAGKIESK